MTRVAAVTFDVMGTLVTIEPPAPRLQRSLERRLGLVVELARCEAGMRAEMRHYRAHCTAAHDAPRSRRCASSAQALLADALALDVSGADLLPSLTDAIVFRAYDDALPALSALAAAGIRLAVVANWDVSLTDVLARLGLAGPVRRGRHGGVRRRREARSEAVRGRTRAPWRRSRALASRG